MQDLGQLMGCCLITASEEGREDPSQLGRGSVRCRWGQGPLAGFRSSQWFLMTGVVKGRLGVKGDKVGLARALAGCSEELHSIWQETRALKRLYAGKGGHNFSKTYSVGVAWSMCDKDTTRSGGMDGKKKVWPDRRWDQQESEAEWGQFLLMA